MVDLRVERAHRQHPRLLRCAGLTLIFSRVFPMEKACVDLLLPIPCVVVLDIRNACVAWLSQVLKRHVSLLVVWTAYYFNKCTARGHANHADRMVGLVDLGSSVAEHALQAKKNPIIKIQRAHQQLLRAGLMQNVVSLELQNNGLTGVLPAELAALPAAKLLDVSGNALSGPLPLDWSRAKPLTLLLASGNALTGKP